MLVCHLLCEPAKQIQHKLQFNIANNVFSFQRQGMCFIWGHVVYKKIWCLLTGEKDTETKEHGIELL